MTQDEKDRESIVAQAMDYDNTVEQYKAALRGVWDSAIHHERERVREEMDMLRRVAREADRHEHDDCDCSLCDALSAWKAKVRNEKET